MWDHPVNLVVSEITYVSITIKWMNIEIVIYKVNAT